MRKVNDSNAKNWDTSDTTSLTSDVMNVMNTDISSWIALTEYPLRNTGATPQGTQKLPHQIKLKALLRMTKKRRDWSRSQSRYSKHHSSSHHDLYRGCSRSQQWDRNSCHRCSLRWSHSAHWGHSCRPHHETAHLSHHKSSTHCSLSGNCSQDHSRLHSWPPYQLNHTPARETKNPFWGGIWRSR